MDKEEVLKQAIENLNKVEGSNVRNITTTTTTDELGNVLLSIKVETGMEQDYETSFMA